MVAVRRRVVDPVRLTGAWLGRGGGGEGGGVRGIEGIKHRV